MGSKNEIEIKLAEVAKMGSEKSRGGQHVRFLLTSCPRISLIRFVMFDFFPRRKFLNFLVSFSFSHSSLHSLGAAAAMAMAVGSQVLHNN